MTKFQPRSAAAHVANGYAVDHVEESGTGREAFSSLFFDEAEIVANGGAITPTLHEAIS